MIKSLIINIVSFSYLISFCFFVSFIVFLIINLFNRKSKSNVSFEIKKELPDKTKLLPVADLRNETKENTAISEFKEKFPQDVFELLWFGDSPYKNYEIPVSETKYVAVARLTDVEPSAIYTNFPITPGEAQKLDYYPRYWNISPEQRFKYLTWLVNIEKPIDIGYVFLFYYGLERHIICGKHKQAFDMILKLRKYHKHHSFLSYSQDILLYHCVIHNDLASFKEFLDCTPIEEIEISNLYIACLKNANIGLCATEIIKLANIAGFKNKRYIKNEYDLFYEKLQNEITKACNENNLNLTKYEFDLSKKENTMMFANFSDDLHKLRQVDIPSIFDNSHFTQDIYMLLQNAHNETKTALKQKRLNK